MAPAPWQVKIAARRLVCAATNQTAPGSFRDMTGCWIGRRARPIKRMVTVSYLVQSFAWPRQNSAGEAVQLCEVLSMAEFHRE